MTIRTRFAPSPTGSLHIGGARTALYNYLLAKKYGGEFILRIEDTDQERNSQAALDAQLRDLQWLGLDWNEGPGKNGPHGPYFQSQRTNIYQQVAEHLLENNRAYYCFASDEMVDRARQATPDNQPFQFQSPDKHQSLEQARQRIKNGEHAVIRFHADRADSAYTFDDLVRGQITLPSDMIGDFVIMRSDSRPVYNFCCVIDDHLMKISHVLRAEEHLPNTLRQLMIYDACDYPRPIFGHLSLILGPDHKKLSKRTGASSCDDYRQAGYSPEGLLNALALLGWSDPQQREILHINDLITAFDTDRLQPAGAVFDDEKCRWINMQHIRQYTQAQIWQAIQPPLIHAGLVLPDQPEWIEQSIALFRDGWHTWQDAIPCYRLLCHQHFDIDHDAIAQAEHLAKIAPLWQQWLQTQSHTYPDASEYQTITKTISTQLGIKGKPLFQSLRLLITGQLLGADLKTLVTLIPITVLQSRCQQIMSTL